MYIYKVWHACVPSPPLSFLYLGALLFFRVPLDPTTPLPPPLATPPLARRACFALQAYPVGGEAPHGVVGDGGVGTTDGVDGAPPTTTATTTTATNASIPAGGSILASTGVVVAVMSLDRRIRNVCVDLPPTMQAVKRTTVCTRGGVGVDVEVGGGE